MVDKMEVGKQYKHRVVSDVIYNCISHTANDNKVKVTSNESMQRFY